MAKKINNKVYEDHNKLYMVADILPVEETEELRKEAASVIKLPAADEKQPDLSYFTAIFVSSGTNLNKAHFMPTELVKAANTVPSKAIDIEHSETEIIGHIYDYAFTDLKGNKLELSDLTSKESSALDKEDMHIVIAGIVYKTRFPDVAKEIAEGKWKVSMETYYSGFDVKIGDLIISATEAEALGFATTKAGIFGSMAKVIKDGVEIAAGEAARVLRGLCFSGVGIVKNPANPPSVVLETAKSKEDLNKNTTEIITLNYDLLKASNNVTSESVNTEINKSEESALDYKDTIGICVNFKKTVTYDGGDQTVTGPDTKITHTDWCSRYNKACTSNSRDTSDPNCLFTKALTETTTACVKKLMAHKKNKDIRESLITNLVIKMDKAVKLL